LATVVYLFCMVSPLRCNYFGFFPSSLSSVIIGNETKCTLLTIFIDILFKIFSFVGYWSFVRNSLLHINLVYCPSEY
jgi:hypothetical protein